MTYAPIFGFSGRCWCCFRYAFHHANCAYFREGFKRYLVKPDLNPPPEKK